MNKILCKVWAFGYFSIAIRILEALKPKLGEAEMRYVNETGPEICRAQLAHSIMREHHSSSEGRSERRLAERLEKEAKKYLTDAGVTEARQSLLKTLLRNTDVDDFIHFFPPKELANIRYKIMNDFESGCLATWLETANMLPGMDNVIRILEDLMEFAEAESAKEVVTK